MTDIKSRPTLYKGIRMRSRLEAKYAASLDGYKIPWEYEPECFAGPEGQWLPDFRHGTGAQYIELKPSSAFDCQGTERYPERNDRVDKILSRMAIAWHSKPEAVLSLVFFDYNSEDQVVTITAWPDSPWQVFVPGSSLMSAIWPGMGQLAATPPANPHAAEAASA